MAIIFKHRQSGSRAGRDGDQLPTGWSAGAQLELKHRERMLDSRFGIGDSGFGMRDTVSRARLYRQLQSSPESVGGILPSPSTAPAPGSFFCRLSPAIVYSFYHLIVFAQHFSIGILHCSKAAAQK
uniref:HDC11854 n=1 Tax=Drosophila melanogaster TaxID=7227 RepID=Q6IKQ3_DROME|nr:TPA_inf: HDC11854 [Drosophila melanogaster]